MIARDGPARAIKAFAEERCWSEPEVWNWIRGDAGRRGEYEEAKKFLSEMGVAETVDIADASGEAKLRVETRFKRAARWWRDVYGEQVKIAHSGVEPVLNIVVLGEVGAVPEVEEKVVEGLTVDDVEIADFERI
ncbi:MAG: hypothetical protein ACREVW_01110 [Burkholderiales bacterium]